MTKYYKTTPEIWPVLAAQVDAQPEFKADWIETRHCEHILPPNLETQSDGFVYVTIPTWMITTRPELVAPFLTYVTEVTQEEYEAVMNAVLDEEDDILDDLIPAYPDEDDIDLE